jgi:hypothetical protein
MFNSELPRLILSSLVPEVTRHCRSFTDDPAAAAAAHAASLAAASAYTHPLADVHQTKHILGPAAYAALALEIDHAGDPSIGDGEVRWATEHVTSEVHEVLLQMPARQAGNSRLDTIHYKLDAGIRSRTLPGPCNDSPEIRQAS